jgi:hypothetical protein
MGSNVMYLLYDGSVVTDDGPDNRTLREQLHT